MDFQDVTRDLTQQNSYWLEKRFEEMMYKNPHYKNLSAANRQLILDLIKKYKEKLRRGLKPSLLTIKNDKYHLYQNRIKLGLTPTDLEQINDLLDSFLK
ncbi:MAG: hypothetical protein WC863_01780 [Patescibacteria group bacterium]